MSANDPINLKQDRRQWLKTSATVLGAAVLPLSGAVAEASPDNSQAAQPAAGATPAATAASSELKRAFFHASAARDDRRVV